MADKDFRVKNGIIVGANAHIEGSITSVDSIQLDTLNPIEPLSAGQMSWNEDSNTVSVGLSVGSVELGQEEHIYIKNQSGNTIGKGNTVMFTGTLGASGRILGGKAVMDGTYPSSYFIGIAKHDIANGDDGYVTSFGKIDQLDTSMFSEGDILYADPGTPGGLSNVAPVAPNNYVTAAAVVHSDATTGVLFVRPTFEGSLVDKEDVFVNSIQDGEALLWNSANARFENGSAGSALELYAENPSSPTAPSATGTNAVAIGNGANSSGPNSFSVHSNFGSSYGATASYAIAMGYRSRATGSYGVAIGRQTLASGSDTVAIGYASSANFNMSVAIGGEASAINNSGGLALGYQAQSVGGSYATAISRSYALGADSLAAAITTNSSSYGATGTSSIAIGRTAKADATYATAIGYNTDALGAYSLAIGVGGQATATESVSITGFINNATGITSSALGGKNSVASGERSVTLGSYAAADKYGHLAYASGQFSAAGDAQTGTFVLRSDTTDATPEALTTNNSTASTDNQIILPNNSAYSFSGTIIARQQASAGSDYASWEIKGALLRDANAASTVLGNGIVNKLYATAGASAWAVALSADTTNGGLKIEVTGAAATNIRWVATVNTSEVTY